MQDAHNEAQSQHKAKAGSLAATLETLHAQQATIDGRMAALGAALQQYLDAHRDKAPAALKKEHAKITKEMAKFSSVNQKAGEELSTFEDEERALQARRKVRAPRDLSAPSPLPHGWHRLSCCAARSTSLLVDYVRLSER